MADNKILETERLLLRRYCEEDFRDLYEYLSDAEVVQYEPYLPMSLEGCPGQPLWKDTYIYSLLENP